MTSTFTDRATRLFGGRQRTAEPGIQRPREAHAEVNVGPSERLVTGLLGVLIAAAGMSLMTRRRSMSGLALALTGGSLAYRGATGYCPGYNALGVRHDDATATSHPLNREVHVEQSVTIRKSPEELYRFWRDLSNLPQVMGHLTSVQELDGNRSRWIAKAPRDQRVEWEAQITEDTPNQRIAWASVPGSEIPNHGSVDFEKAFGDRGTIVRVNLGYQPPMGVVGAVVARLFGEAPDQQVADDLRRFKQRMETGEVATTHGQPRGTCGRG